MSATVTQLRPAHHPEWRTLDDLVLAALKGLAPDDAVFEDFGITRPQLRHLTEVALGRLYNKTVTVPLDGPTMDDVCRRYRDWMSKRECDL